MANAANSKQIILNSNFFVPPGVVDVRAQTDDDAVDTFYDVGDIAVEGPTLDDPEDVVPMPPSSYTIVEQRVRLSAGGQAVVDVTLEFPDVYGIETIEVRTTKA